MGDVQARLPFFVGLKAVRRARTNRTKGTKRTDGSRICFWRGCFLWAAMVWRGLNNLVVCGKLGLPEEDKEVSDVRNSGIFGTATSEEAFA